MPKQNSSMIGFAQNRNGSGSTAVRPTATSAANATHTAATAARRGSTIAKANTA